MKLVLVLVASIGGMTTGCCAFGSRAGTGPPSEAPAMPSAEVPATTDIAPEPAVVPAAPTGSVAEPSVLPLPSAEAEVEDPAPIERAVSAADVETWRAAPGGILRSTEMAPASGETGSGARLFGIRAGDPMAELGFQNGDIVHTLNGMSVSDEESLRGAFEQLRRTSSYDAEIIRRGAPETLHVTVRE